MDILNKTVVDPLLEKELLVASKGSNIRVVDKTSSLVGKNFVDFESIKRDLLSGENSSKILNKPPVVCTSTSVVQKNCDVNTSSDIRLRSTQDMELSEILEELQSSNEIISSDSSCDVIPDKRRKGYLCSDTVFTLSGRVLSEYEIKFLEKGLDFAPFQRKVNEPELRRDFEEFCRRMRINWHFRNEISEDFSDVPALSPMSSWNSPQGYPNLKVYLSQVANELFSIADEPIRYSNLSKEEWIAMRSLADDRSIVIKKADKGSCIVVWDRNDYLRQAEKQLEDPNVYRKVAFKDKICPQLVDFSNRFFKNLKMKGHITEKELKYFSYEFKKSCNLGKVYLLPKIHKSLENVPGRPVISNCGTPTETVSEFLDHHLKPVMQGGKSYIKDSAHFLEKIKTSRCIPDNALLVTADVVGLYPCTPLQAGLIALKKALDKRLLKKIPTDDLIKMAEFVLNNNFFEFNSDTFQQISGTAIGTKFAPPYACIYMDQVEQKFLATQINQPLIWLRCINNIFFIWTRKKN